MDLRHAQWHGHYSPLQTAVVFVSLVIAVDALFITPVVEGSFEMFASPLVTWIPFALIFVSAYLTGRGVRQRPRHATYGRRNHGGAESWR